MRGMGAIAVLIGLAGVPVLIAYFWLYLRRKAFVPLPFLVSLGAGLLAPGVAALAQYALPVVPGGTLLPLLFRIFIRIALIEEGSKFLVLYGVIAIGRRLGETMPAPVRAAAAGLTVGLGFALVETASYAWSGPGLAVVRALTAAPLHGACGARVGLAAYDLGSAPLRAVLRFLSAVAIHGMYNLFLLLPGVPFFIPAALAFVALAASVALIGSQRPDLPA